MRRKICLMGYLFIASTYGWSAQNPTVTVDRDTSRSYVAKEIELFNPLAPYAPYSWGEGWFLQLGVGGQIYLNRGFNKGPLQGNLAPTFQLSAAKWLLPSLGVRFQFQGFQMKGFSKTEGWYTSPEQTAKGGYPYSAKYDNFHFDVLWNTSRDFVRTPLRTSVYSLIPYVGFGLSGYYFKEKPDDVYHRHNVFSMHAGIINNFRLNDNWSLFADLQVSAQAWSPNLKVLEGFFGASSYGFAVPLTIGVTYTIGKPKRNNFLKGVAMVERVFAKEVVTQTRVVERKVEKEVEKIVEKRREPSLVEPKRVEVKTRATVSEQNVSETVIQTGQPYFSIHVLRGMDRRLDSPIFKGMEPVLKIYEEGKYHYFIGKFSTKQEIDEAMVRAKRIFKKPYPVVILNNRFSRFLAK